MSERWPDSHWDFAGIELPADDAVVAGADLAPGTILAAYRCGLFPMPTGGRLVWWSPLERGVLRPGELKVSRSLRRSVGRFSASVDTDFKSVIDACADERRTGRWITPAIRAAYLELHRLGWAHSVEVRDDEGELVGGLYGVSLGRLFCGESMFHRATDASKVALVHLVDVMGPEPDWLIDTQWQTPHLASLGVSAMAREEYLGRLEGLVGGQSPFKA